MQRPEILHEDPHLLVVNKPAGLLTLPDRYEPGAQTLVAYLEKYRDKIFVVHRLDRDTSGLIVVALTAAAHQRLSMQFAGRAVEKHYLALVDGSVGWQQRTIDLPLRVNADRRHRTRVDHRDGKRASTSVNVLERFDAHALVEALPQTGRTHQIRVHLAAAGHPIIGDPLYGAGKPLYLSSFKRRYNPGRREERPLIARTALHASRLRFKHPDTDQYVLHEVEPPRDFSAAVSQLRKYGKTMVLPASQEPRQR